MDSTSRVIAVRVQALFYVPNAFTPDGDDKNNIFSPVMTAGVDPQHYNLKIYNRWGNVIREFNAPDFKWDGTDKRGSKMTDGTYFYMIKAKTISGQAVEKSGFVQIVN